MQFSLASASQFSCHNVSRARISRMCPHTLLIRHWHSGSLSWKEYTCLPRFQLERQPQKQPGLVGQSSVRSSGGWKITSDLDFNTNQEIQQNYPSKRQQQYRNKTKKLTLKTEESRKPGKGIAKDLGHVTGLHSSN